MRRRARPGDHARVAVTRRHLLGAAAGTVALAGCGAKKRPVAAARLDPRDWASVRAQFELDPHVRDFAAFTLAPHPRPVREAIARHRAGLDRGTHAYMGAHQPQLESAVAAAAGRFLGVPPAQVAFTDSTTAGLGLMSTTVCA